jgi:hypothetical protein
MDRQRIYGGCERRLPQPRSEASSLKVLLPTGRVFLASGRNIVVITPLSSIYSYMALNPATAKLAKEDNAQCLLHNLAA